MEITVVIPTYNREDLISRSIDSIIAQESEECKILVVDDCSTDGTGRIIHTYEEKYGDRVKYYRLDKNSGPAAARNMGARLAETEWIAFNDSDDVWHKDKLKKQAAYYESHSDVDLIYSGYRGYHESGEISTTPDRDLPYELEGYIYSSLLVRNSIGAPTVLVKRDSFIEAGGFDEEYLCLEDWEFAIRFSSNHKIGFVDEDLVDAYISNSGVSCRISDYYISRCQIVKDNLSGIMEYKLFDEIVGDIFERANRRGILDQVQMIMESMLK